MNLQLKAPRVDPKLALVEILNTLAAIHRRFSKELPPPLPPRIGKGHPFKSQEQKEGENKAYQRRLARRERLLQRSLELSGCSELESVGKTVVAYRDWLEKLIEGDFAAEGDVYQAAMAVVRDARELCSIARLVHAFPDSAARRAKRIAAK